MKVVIQSYNTCMQNENGGVKTKINNIYHHLMKSKMDIELFNKFNTKIKGNDILHIFRLDTENLELILFAKKNNVKVVLSTIINSQNLWKLKLYKLLSFLPTNTTYKIMRKELENCDKVIAETVSEKRILKKYYNVSEDKITIIGNGIDRPKEQKDYSIYDKLGKECKYILQVGRFDENKNQLNVIKALKNQDIDIVFIGGPTGATNNYYDKCIKEANNSNKFHFLGWIDHNSDLLKSAYQNAELFILPSHHETFGITAIEAGSIGCKIALSKTLPILEYESLKKCKTFNPNNIKDIKENIIEAFNEEKDEKFKNKIYEEFNWDKITKQYIDCYNEVLNNEYSS